MQKKKRIKKINKINQGEYNPRDIPTEFIGRQVPDFDLPNLLDANDRALADGLPLHRLGVDHVFVQVAAGDPAGAVATLNKLLDAGQLAYRVYYAWPHFRVLQGREDFQALKLKHLKRVNAERALLDWPAVEDTGL